MRIDEIDIFQVDCCSFIGYIYFLAEWKIPDREGFKLGIARFDPSFVFMIELPQTGAKLSTARTRAGDDYNRFVGGNIFVWSITFIADNRVHIRRIPFGVLMGINFHAPSLQLVLKSFGRRLTRVSGDDNRIDINPPLFEVVNSFHGIGIISDPEIGSYFLPFNIPGIDTENDIDLIFQPLEKAHFNIGIKSRQYPGCMVVKK